MVLHRLPLGIRVSVYRLSCRTTADLGCDPSSQTSFELALRSILGLQSKSTNHLRVRVRGLLRGHIQA